MMTAAVFTQGRGIKKETCDALPLDDDGCGRDSGQRDKKRRQVELFPWMMAAAVVNQGRGIKKETCDALPLDDDGCGRHSGQGDEKGDKLSCSPG